MLGLQLGTPSFLVPNMCHSHLSPCTPQFRWAVTSKFPNVQQAIWQSVIQQTVTECHQMLSTKGTGDHPSCYPGDCNPLSTGGMRTRSRWQAVQDRVEPDSEDLHRAEEVEWTRWARGRLACGKHSVNMYWGSHLPRAESFWELNPQGEGRQAKPLQHWPSPRWTQMSGSIGTDTSYCFISHAPEALILNPWSTVHLTLDCKLSDYRSGIPVDFKEPEEFVCSSLVSGA